MIVRILSRGRSFSGLANYLTHDAKAETEERVGWTHTLNLANDNVAGAVDEMLWTSRDAELLKMEAGIRAGGRDTENPVKHLSLNWAPGEEPTREHMIATAEDFLRHMNWQDHQALIVSHEDKTYRHCHVMLNAIHPETGLKLDDGFEYRRAQSWALGYEREHGLHCDQRLKDEREREDGPTRPAWKAFENQQKIFEEAEKSRAAQPTGFEINPEKPDSRIGQEWKALKELQREERQGFFAEGKQAFSELRLGIYQEVREEFRERWADYYSQAKGDGDPSALKETKAALVAEQKAALEQRRDEACAALRQSRDLEYQELLSGQREMRSGLRARQDAGLDSLDLIDSFRVQRDAPARGVYQDNVRQGDDESGDRPFVFEESEGKNGLRSGDSIAVGIAEGMTNVVGDFLIHITGGAAPRPKPQVEARPRGPDLFALAAQEASQNNEHTQELEEERRREDEVRSRQ